MGGCVLFQSGAASCDHVTRAGDSEQTRCMRLSLTFIHLKINKINTITACHQFSNQTTGSQSDQEIWNLATFQAGVCLRPFGETAPEDTRSQKTRVVELWSGFFSFPSTVFISSTAVFVEALHIPPVDNPLDTHTRPQTNTFLKEARDGFPASGISVTPERKNGTCRTFTFYLRVSIIHGCPKQDSEPFSSSLALIIALLLSLLFSSSRQIWLRPSPHYYTYLSFKWLLAILCLFFFTSLCMRVPLPEFDHGLCEQEFSRFPHRRHIEKGSWYVAPASIRFLMLRRSALANILMGYFFGLASLGSFLNVQRWSPTPLQSEQPSHKSHRSGAAISATWGLGIYIMRQENDPEIDETVEPWIDR